MKKIEEMGNTNKISDTQANMICIGTTTVMLIIAGFSLPVSLGILGAETLGCAALTIKKSRKEK